MHRALELAALGGPATRPNPQVGCVVADAAGNVLAEGWHQRYGGPHAEVNAVASLFARPDAPPDLRGLRVFVTLEPCAHHGKTPPCADLLICHGATEVVVATLDPNPLVGGRGVAKLRAAGCNVSVGLLETEARWLNRRFFTVQQERRPWVVLKWAQSADGFLTGPNARPRPITGEATRRLVHRWRTEEAVILVGAGTARTDNPRLDTRHWPGPAPMRVVLTGAQSLPADLWLLADGSPTLVYGPASTLPPPTADVAPVAVAANLPALPFLLSDLYVRGLQSVLVEGGAAVLNAFLTADLWDEIRILTNPALRLASGVAAPRVPTAAHCHATVCIGGDEIREYRR